MLVCPFGTECKFKDVSCGKKHVSVCGFFLKGQCHWKASERKPCRCGEHPMWISDGVWLMSNGSKIGLDLHKPVTVQELRSLKAAFDKQIKQIDQQIELLEK